MKALCESLRSQIFQSKTSLHYFPVGIHDKIHPVKLKIFVLCCTAESCLWDEILFYHLGNVLCNSDFLQGTSFCSLINTIRICLLEIPGKEVVNIDNDNKTKIIANCILFFYCILLRDFIL